MYPKEFRLPGLRLLARFNAATSFSDDGDSGLRAQQVFGANPGNLRMFLYMPPSLPKGAPLVVVLHGCTQNASSYDEGAGWTRLASQFGFAVLAPEQTRENNPNLCFNWFSPGDTARGQGEAASIRQMIEWAVTTHGLDRKRIFITGLSAGAAMTGALLAAYPEVFAGGAIIAGLPVGAAANVPEALAGMRHAASRSPSEWGDKVRRVSSHAGVWPRLSIWHGDADATVHPSNAEALIAQWTHLHELGLSPTDDMPDEGHRLRTWSRGGRVMVEARNIRNLGHGTPVAPEQGLGRAGPHFLDVGISSTVQIAAFWEIAEPEQAVRRGKRKGTTASLVGQGVGNTIRKALQSAGLLKG